MEYWSRKFVDPWICGFSKTESELKTFSVRLEQLELVIDFAQPIPWLTHLLNLIRTHSQ
jgi:hypothetical protein